LIQGGNKMIIKKNFFKFRMDDSDDDGSKAPRQHATADIGN